MTAKEKLTAQAVWTLEDIVSLCVKIESICPNHGCHVALTGGLLYKGGKRKDADLLFYRIRQVSAIDKESLFAALARIGLKMTEGFGWCHKGEYHGKPLDLFFPEEDGAGVSNSELPDPADKSVQERDPLGFGVGFVDSDLLPEKGPPEF